MKNSDLATATHTHTHMNELSIRLASGAFDLSPCLVIFSNCKCRSRVRFTDGTRQGLALYTLSLSLPFGNRSVGSYTPPEMRDRTPMENSYNSCSLSIEAQLARCIVGINCLVIEAFVNNVFQMFFFFVAVGRIDLYILFDKRSMFFVILKQFIRYYYWLYQIMRNT